MANVDRLEDSCSCPCGKGSIRIVQEMPDHPYARVSQTSYTATLRCDECSKTLCIVDDMFVSKPYIGIITEVEARDSAKAQFFKESRQFSEDPLAKSIQPALIAEIDAAHLKSKAAAWRVLKKHGLTHDSQATFSKRPKTGVQALKEASGGKLANIGMTEGKTEEDRTAFAKV